MAMDWIEQCHLVLPWNWELRVDCRSRSALDGFHFRQVPARLELSFTGEAAEIRESSKIWKGMFSERS
jgi:hypothetical protein